MIFAIKSAHMVVATIKTQEEFRKKGISMECLELFEIRSMGVGENPIEPQVAANGNSCKWHLIFCSSHTFMTCWMVGWLAGWFRTDRELLLAINNFGVSLFCLLLFLLILLQSSSHVYAWFNEDGYCAVCVWDSRRCAWESFHIWDVGRRQTRRWMPASSRYFMIVYYEHLI